MLNMPEFRLIQVIFHLIHHWLAATDKPGNLIRFCMIDYSKAFDRIDHNILLMKLSNFDVPPILINWCANFLKDRQFLFRQISKASFVLK